MIIVSVVIALCVAYAVRRLYLIVRKPEKSGGCCGGCHGGCRHCP